MIQDSLGNFSNEGTIEISLPSANGNVIQATLPPVESSTEALIIKASSMAKEQTKKAVLGLSAILNGLGLKEDAKMLTPDRAANILAWVGVATIMFKVKKNIVPVGVGLAALYYYNNFHKKGLQPNQTQIIDRALA